MITFSSANCEENVDGCAVKPFITLTSISCEPSTCTAQAAWKNNTKVQPSLNLMWLTVMSILTDVRHKASVKAQKKKKKRKGALYVH